MKMTWQYLQNQFLAATRTTYKKALKLSNYHDAYLEKMMNENPLDMDFTTLYNRYHPIHLAYVAAYNTWKNAGGQQEGQTLNLDQMLTLLVSKAARWDARVQVEFEKGSPTYKAIFPNGRAPFIKGAYSTRILAVQTLGTALAVNPILAALKAEVDTFYTDIDAARDTQEGAKGGTKAGSDALDNQRITTMTEQYRNLGFLINKWATTPLLIEPFFELNILRDHRQTLFTGTLDPAENEAILTHTFLADDEIEFEITGLPTVPAGTSVKFYLASMPNGTDSTAVTITVNTGKVTLPVSAFGAIDLATHRHLTGLNESLFEMHYEVELL